MNLRKTALSLLSAWEEKSAFINLLLSDRVLADAGDGADFLTALLYGTVERKITLDYLIGALSGRSPEDVSPHTRQLLRLGLYELLYLHTPAHASVNETVSLGETPGERAFLNAILRKADRERDALPLPPRDKPARYLSVSRSFPLPLVKRFLSLFGEEDTAALLDAFNTVSPLTLCVSPAYGRDRYLSDLRAAGIDAEACRYSPLGVRLSRSVPPASLPLFDRGVFFVQDEASQIAGEALSPAPGQTVIDVCACPGGKTFGAAFRAGETAAFTACDLYSSKLSLITSGAERLGIDVSVRELDAAAGDASLDGTADRVICDVPCSGLGVLGKKADLRYRDIDVTLPALQSRILARSFSYLRPGGVLVYSTCTLLPEENENNVRAFLAAAPDAVAEDFTVGSLSSKEGMLTLYPHIHGTDGFFIAKLRKRNP